MLDYTSINGTHVMMDEGAFEILQDMLFGPAARKLYRRQRKAFLRSKRNCHYKRYKHGRTYRTW